MDVVIGLFIILMVVTMIFGLLIYSRIEEICDKLEVEHSYVVELMGQLRGVQEDLEKLKKDNRWKLKI